MPTLTLRNGALEYQLCRYPEECGPKQAALSFDDPISALYFLREIITDSWQQHELRLWLTDINSSFEMYAISDDSILEQTARLLASGQILIAGAQEGGGGGAQEGAGEGFLRNDTEAGSVLVSNVETTPRQDEEARAEEKAANQEAAEEAAASEEEESVTEVEPSETTWIELELFDSKGNPVPNERYKITMPDGSVLYGRLDSHAKARIEKLQPGTCQVTFPDRDEEVWEVG